MHTRLRFFPGIVALLADSVTCLQQRGVCSCVRVHLSVLHMCLVCQSFCYVHVHIHACRPRSPIQRSEVFNGEAGPEGPELSSCKLLGQYASLRCSCGLCCWDCDVWQRVRLPSCLATTAAKVLDSRVKAAHVKTLVFFLAGKMCDLAGHVRPERRLHAQQRASMIWGLARMLKIWSSGSYPFLTPQEKEESVQRGQEFLLLYQTLAGAALNERKALYRVKPKHHYLCHLLSFVAATGLNPAHTSCFCDEDLMGKVARLGRATAHRAFMCRTIQRLSLIHI